MRRVIVESPFRAATPEGIVANVEYARACVRDCILRGESPLASHLLLTQPGILRDEVQDERNLGIEAGLAWQTSAECVVVYTDRGITDGMELAVDRAQFYKIPVEYRSLNITSEAA